MNNNNTQNNKKNDSIENKIGVISLILFLIVPVLIIINPKLAIKNFTILTWLCPLFGIVLMIEGRIKYPTNKFLKTVMWIIIISIILGLVLFIFLSIAGACSSVAVNAIGAGCSVIASNGCPD